MNYSLKYKVASAALAVSLLVGGVGSFSASNVYAAEVSAADQVANITWGVNLRADSNTSSKIIRFLSKGEKVTVSGFASNGWYRVTDSKGNVGYISNDAKYTEVVGSSSSSNSSSNSNGSIVDASTQSGTVIRGVNMRKGPGTSYAKIRMLSKGEQVSIISQSNGWYKLTDKNGVTGYVSTSSQYISLSGSSSNTGSNGSGSSNSGSTNNGSNSGSTTPSSTSVEKVISAGMKYLGTPYEFGSNRNTTTTFDCSDFVRQAFKDALGITLPADSRQQGTYVKNKGNTVTSIKNLKRGDLMFFMSYKGTSASSYSGINKSTQRITHVGIYLGDGKILHTYSKDSGGVRTDTVTGKHWEYRFLYGGSAL